eukprot:scaffold10485_cov35-Attheya_sp.AAC.2
MAEYQQVPYRAQHFARRSDDVGCRMDGTTGNKELGEIIENMRSLLIVRVICDDNEGVQVYRN